MSCDQEGVECRSREEMSYRGWQSSEPCSSQSMGLTRGLDGRKKEESSPSAASPPAERARVVTQFFRAVCAKEIEANGSTSIHHWTITYDF
jgi:hypothetical protein